MNIKDYITRLKRGGQESPYDGEGLCAMEYVAQLSGLPITDKPRNVDPIIRKYCIILNESLESSNQRKDYFLPVINLIKGTNTKNPITNKRREKLWREIVNNGLLVVHTPELFYNSILKLRHCDTTLEYLDQKSQTVKKEIKEPVLV